MQPLGTSITTDGPFSCPVGGIGLMCTIRGITTVGGIVRAGIIHGAGMIRGGATLTGVGGVHVTGAGIVRVMPGIAAAGGGAAGISAVAMNMVSGTM